MRTIESATLLSNEEFFETFFKIFRLALMEIELIKIDYEFISNINPLLRDNIKKNIILYRNYFERIIPSVYRQFEEETLVYFLSNNIEIENKVKIVNLLFDILLSFFSSLRSIVEYYQRLLPSEKIPYPLLISLLKSFGLYNQFFLNNLPESILRKILALLVRIYKFKGTSHSVELFLRTVLFGNFKIIELYVEKVGNIPNVGIEFLGFNEENGRKIRKTYDNIIDDRWWILPKDFEIISLED